MSFTPEDESAIDVRSRAVASCVAGTRRNTVLQDITGAVVMRGRLPLPVPRRAGTAHGKSLQSSDFYDILAQFQ